MSKGHKNKHSKRQPQGQVAQSASQKAKAALVAASKPPQAAKAESPAPSSVVMRLDRVYAPKVASDRPSDGGKSAKRGNWLARLLSRTKAA